MIELETLKKKIIYRANYRGTKRWIYCLVNLLINILTRFSKSELEDLFDFLNMEDEIIYNFYQTKKIDKKIKKIKY